MKKISLLIVLVIGIFNYSYADSEKEITLRILNENGEVFFPDLEIVGYEFYKGKIHKKVINIKSFKTSEIPVDSNDKYKITEKGYSIMITRDFTPTYMEIYVRYKQKLMKINLTRFYDFEVYCYGYLQDPAYEVKFEEGKNLILFQKGLFTKEKHYFKNNNFKIFEDTVFEMKDNKNLYRRLSENKKHKFKKINLEELKSNLYKQSVFELNHIIFDKKFNPIGKSDSYSQMYIIFSRDFKKIISKYYNKNKVQIDCDEEGETEIIGF